MDRTDEGQVAAAECSKRSPQAYAEKSTHREALRERIMDFVGRASLEVTPHDEDSLAAIAAHLDPATTLYVAHTPKASMEDIVRVACRIQEMGLHACPHIAARRIESAASLRSALVRLHNAGCGRVLLIAGDCPEAAGPFESTLDILASDVLTGHGLDCVAVAGHPEGNLHVNTTTLWHALEQKQAFGERTGIRICVVSQFAFNAQAILAWVREMSVRGIVLPVDVGLAGPASADNLLRYALRCGVGATLRTAVSRTRLMVKLAKSVRSVDRVLTALVGSLTEADRAVVIRPHFFPFGGAEATARWLRALRAGCFELNASGSGFVVHP